MNFPVWDLPFAHGLLIATVAILHVYVSHFAIGGGLYLVLSEHLARRRNDGAMLEVLKRHSRFFMLLTLVFGAISGVGIWFTIGLINPSGTSSLIHAFVWGWAIEWTFFVTEIAAAMFYYYGWGRLTSRQHLTVGWIYFVAAWLSMVVINGILSFQLTPGDWLETRDFWDGFFNPTYWSSLFARTFFAVGLGGLFAMITAVRWQEIELRAWLLRFSGVWSIVGIAGAVACTYWWWLAVPEEIRAVTDGDMPFASLVTHWTPLLTVFLAVLILAGPLASPRFVRTPAVAVLILVGLLTMGAGEWVRESIRKPWIVGEYLYSNGVLADEVDELREDGLLANANWVDASRTQDELALGEELFRVACQNCHSRTGYNGMAQRVQDWDREYTAAIIERIEYTRRRMPPWVGTTDEANALAAYLMTLKPDGMADVGSVSGRDIYEMRCSPCHSLDGFRSLRELVEGLSAEELDEYMQEMESDYMPPFTGSDEERQILAEFLAAVGEGTEQEFVSARGVEAREAMMNAKCSREEEGTR